MRIPNLWLEQELQANGYRLIAGLDEVGRGAWAGPLVAGAVILRRGRRLYRIRDSKLLSAKRRDKLSRKIKRRCRSWSVGVVEANELNRIGLARGIKLSQSRAIRKLRVRPDYVLVDGNGKHSVDRIKSEHVIKADQKVLSVAAASVIAKVYRDRLMVRLARKHPQYGFDRHKGYGTKLHQSALRDYGICPEHRRFYKSIAPFST